jgi:hypothetical protein
MGAVYKAHDPFLDRDVALKVMLPQIAGDPEQKHRFEREARAVAKMTHPNVVTIFDLGYHSDGSPYIAMELLQGRDLFQTMQLPTPLAREQKLSVILQVLDGVAHAHRAGIVHRDIKPANTFLTEEGVVKIMDFGVARFTAASMTATGIVVGTANYMAPEQVNGAKVDGRADLFSIGCLLYELALGTRPFESESLMSTLWKIVHEEPEYERFDALGLAGLVPLLRRALAKSAEQRYQTAADFGDALRAFAAQLTSGSAEAATPREAVGRTSTASAGTTVALEEPPAPAPREPRPPADPTPLFALMREVQLGARSGQLHFTHGRERRSLRIERGAVVHGTSDVPNQHLGNVLVRYGLLSQADLERATEVVLRDRRRLGQVVAELRLLSREHVREAVAIHVREILFEVTERDDGSFAFEEMSHEELTERETPACSMGEMIVETARRIQSPQILARVIGDLDRVVSLSTQPLLRAQPLPLTSTDAFLLSRVDGVATAREVLGSVPLPPDDVERSLFSLLCTGMIEYVTTPEPATDAGRAKPTPAEVPSPVRSRKQAIEEERCAILEAHEALAGKNHFQLLGLEPGCSNADLDAAFRTRALRFHPDHALDPSLAELRGKRVDVYARLLEAHEVLRDPEKRSRYKATLDARELRTQLQPPAPPTSPAAASLHVEGPLDPQTILDGIRDAQKLIREEKAWDAIQLLEPLISRAEGHSRFRAQVLLSRAYLKNPRWVKRAEEILYGVVREAPEHAEAYVVLGNIYRSGDLRTRAVAMYNRALALHPGHGEASEALAELDPDNAGSDRDPLLKRLFGKATKGS